MLDFQLCDISRPAPRAAPRAAPVPGEPDEASAYYDLSQYEHYEQPAEEDAASRALLARLKRDAEADGKPRT